MRKNPDVASLSRMLIPISLIFACLLVPTVVFACPSCKEFLKSGPAALGGLVRQAEGYFWSILFMVSAPFLVTGTVAGLIVNARRRARK
jgi:hypothetical protein